MKENNFQELLGCVFFTRMKKLLVVPNIKVLEDICKTSTEIFMVVIYILYHKISPKKLG